MKGILILAHGSKAKETEETLEQIVAMLREELEGQIIGTAFLQFSEQNLEAGLDSLVAKGVSDISVIPYFLFDGNHIKEDIPEEIKAYLIDKKDINISLGKTLGSDSRLAMVLADRVRECL